MELQALPFRGLPDFLILLLALASAAALAWRRRFALFETALLGFAAVVAFRSQRDVWAMAAVGALILASTIAGYDPVAEVGHGDSRDDGGSGRDARIPRNAH